MSIHSDDDGHDKMTISVTDDDHKFKANIDGKIAFNADETDVASLGAGGTASFEETRGGVTHRIEFADRNGKIERRYFVDRQEQPFDAAGSKWFAGLLPALIRESGLGAEARVQRLYSAGGAGRVLDEIERIHSDYVRGIYLGLLLDRGTLTPPQLDQALKIAGAASSDYERHQMLSRIFAKQPLSAAQQITFLQQALRFDSDYELAELLIGVVPKLANSPEVRQAWLTAALQRNVGLRAAADARVDAHARQLRRQPARQRARGQRLDGLGLRTPRAARRGRAARARRRRARAGLRALHAVARIRLRTARGVARADPGRQARTARHARPCSTRPRTSARTTSAAKCSSRWRA